MWPPTKHTIHQMPNGAFENISGNHQMGPGKELEPDAQLGGGGGSRSASEEMGPDAIISRQEKPSLKHLQARGVHFI